MRQSTIIFGTLLFTFIVYITLRGQLPQYLALFTSKKSAATSTASASNTNASSSGGSKSVIEMADSAIQSGQRLSQMFNLGFG